MGSNFQNKFTLTMSPAAPGTPSPPFRPAGPWGSTMSNINLKKIQPNEHTSL